MVRHRCHLLSVFTCDRKERLQLRRSKEDEDLPLPACMQQQQQPALPAQDGASKHFRVRNGWQAAVVGVGMGVMDGGKASGQEKNARAGLMSGRPLEVRGVICVYSCVCYLV